MFIAGILEIINAVYCMYVYPDAGATLSGYRDMGCGGVGASHKCCILYVRTQMLGLLSLAIGIWGVVVSVQGDYEVLTGSNLISGAVLLIVSGFITIVVSMLGFCGAAGMWRPILVIVSFRRPPQNFSLSIELC